MIGDCRKCRDGRTCIGKDWFNFAEIRWCVHQVLWILAHIDTLKAGRWPKEPNGSSGGDSGRRNVRTEASFVQPELAIGEVEVRLKTTGISGRLLVAQAKASETLETLDDEAWEVLMFVKGWRRKTMNFGAWKRQRRYRQRNKGD